MGDTPIYGLLLAEQLEVGIDGGANPISWDFLIWVGSDSERLRVTTEGAVATDVLGLETELQVLYSRLVLPFMELQVGVRGDLEAGDGELRGRVHLAFGLTGMAPYGFEMGFGFFMSHRGNVSMRLRVAHDLFVTQKLIAETSFETNIAVQAVPDFGIGAGINDIQLEFRLRYELIREFAPYVGVSWYQGVFDTVALRRRDGLAPSEVRGVVGVRWWL